MCSFILLCDIINNMKYIVEGTQYDVIINRKNIELKDGKLADIAPTIIELLDLPKPLEMTGDSLIK